MSVAKVDRGVVVLKDLEGVKELRARVAAFGRLFGVHPAIKVSGAFTCAKSGDPVWLRDREPVTSIARNVVVDLGTEGAAVVPADQVKTLRFYLSSRAIID